MESWGIGGEPENWLSQLHKQPWVTPEIKAWMEDRARRFGEPSHANSRADNNELLWQCIPAIAAGYFDDGIFLGESHASHTQRARRRLRERNTERATHAPCIGLEPVVDAMDDAIFKLMHCGIEAAWHKFERR